MNYMRFNHPHIVFWGWSRPCQNNVSRNYEKGLKRFTLWLFKIAMGNGPYIDGLPINSMVIFHGYVK
jgi:hypothetical protein